MPDASAQVPCFTRGIVLDGTLLRGRTEMLLLSFRACDASRVAPLALNACSGTLLALRDPAGAQDVRASQSVIRLLISSGRSTSMKWPTPSISSASDPGPA